MIRDGPALIYFLRNFGSIVLDRLQMQRKKTRANTGTGSSGFYGKLKMREKGDNTPIYQTFSIFLMTKGNFKPFYHFEVLDCNLVEKCCTISRFPTCKIFESLC